MFPFDVILFDVGGVLLTNGWDHGERALALEHFHLDRAAFEARQSRALRRVGARRIPVKDYLTRPSSTSRATLPRTSFSPSCSPSRSRSPMGHWESLSELAASDKCMLGALNNEARETNEYRFDSFGLRRIFQVALSSCYLGLRKPDLAIYQRALDILGRPAERILFIDDRAENVAGAEAAGMNCASL